MRCCDISSSAHAHAEGVEPAAAVLLGRAQRPEAGRLGQVGEALVVVVRQLLRVRIHALLGGDDLLLHEAADLLAQHPQFIGKREARERKAWSASERLGAENEVWRR